MKITSCYKFLLLLTAVCGFCLQPNLTHAQVSFRTVALSSTPVPGIPDANFVSNFSTPTLNEAGQVAFQVSIASEGPNGDAIFIGDNNGLRRVAQQFTQVPGAAPGVLFGSLSDPSINDLGQVAFETLLTGTDVDSNNNSAILSEGSGALSIVAREGSFAPGVFVDTEFSFFNDPIINNNGQIAFLGNVRGTDINFANDGSIFLGDDTGLTLIARDGDAAPNAPPGDTIAQFSSPLLNNADQVVFGAGGFGAGVFRFTPGEGLGTVVSSGDIAPVPGSATFSVGASANPALNDAGEVAFNAAGQGIGGLSVFIDGEDGLAVVAQARTVAPGTGGIEFLSTLDTSFNNAGETAFRAILSSLPDSVNFLNDEAIFAESGGELGLIARGGDQAPGTEPGVLFNVFENPVINDAGQVAFLVELTNADGTPSNEEGLFATDENGELQLIVRTGDLFDVDNDPLTEDLREIIRISFENIGFDFANFSRRQDAFNANGELAFGLTFSASGSPGGNGVFLASTTSVVPEPSTGVLLVLMLTGATGFRRRTAAASVARD